MESEAEKSWSLAKESCPTALVFTRSSDIYYLRGSDVEIVKSEFGIRCFGSSVGFDTEQAWYYMRKLVERGHAVLRVERGEIRPVVPRNGNSPRAPRPRGRFIAIDPRLVFDASTLQRVKAEPEYLYEQFRDLLLRNDLRRLRDHGELYVFEFDGWYEVDWELTTFLPSRLRLLARAASDTNEKLPCRLVLPKAWRGRKKRQSHDNHQPSQPAKVGQLTFKLD